MDYKSNTSNNYKSLLYILSIIFFSIFITLTLSEFYSTFNYSSAQEINNNHNTWDKCDITISHLTFSWPRAIAFSVILFIGYMIYKFRLRKVLRQKEEIEKMFRNRTRELKEMNHDLILAKKEMDDILENVKEGLFLINKNYMIESQYSAALEGILSKKNLAKTSFINYFSNKLNEKEVKSIKEYLDIMFDESLEESLINHLNPLSNTKLEFSYTQEDTITKYLTFEFGRIVQDGHIVKIIASVNDITEKLIMEQNLQLSRREAEQRTNRLQIILSIEPALLREFIVSTKDELSILNKIVKEKMSIDIEKLNELYRSIHVIKGNASLLGFTFFSDYAHEIEDFIAEIHKEKNYTKVSMYNLKCLVVGLNDLYHELKTLIERLRKFLEQFKIENDEESIILIRSLKRFINQISQEKDIQVKLKTSKFDNSVIPSKYRIIIKNIIIQLVRNSIYHGVENTEERLKNNKNKQATIELSCYETEDSICIKVRDDGRGLQVTQLREKAVASGIWNSAEVNNWDEQQVYHSIFTPGISTAKDVNMTAGRGVGMDVIKNKLDEINGIIKIRSKEGRYTLFTVEIPHISEPKENVVADLV